MREKFRIPAADRARWGLGIDSIVREFRAGNSRMMI
jgi:hypothetical protein